VASTFVRLSIFHAGECFSLVAPPPPLFVSAIAVRFDVISRWILPKVCSVLLHKLSMYIQYELGTLVAMGLQFIFVSCILFIEYPVGLSMYIWFSFYMYRTQPHYIGCNLRCGIT
jgi:hypothetical protein